MFYLNNKQKKVWYYMMNSSSNKPEFLWIVNEDNKASLIYYMGDAKKVKVPKKVSDERGTYNVNIIEASCFAYSNVETLIISEGIEEVR